MRHLYATYPIIPRANMAIMFLIERGIEPPDFRILAQRVLASDKGPYDSTAQSALGIQKVEIVPSPSHSTNHHPDTLANFPVRTITTFSDAMLAAVPLWTISDFILESGVHAKQAAEVSKLVETGGALLRVSIPSVLLQRDEVEELLIAFGGELFLPPDFRMHKRNDG